MKEPIKPTLPSPAENLRETVSRHLFLEDSWVLDVSLATDLANLEGTEPQWFLLVNPPSTAKTEMVRLFTKVPYCAWLPEVTDKTFLSSYVPPKNEKKKDTPSKPQSLLHRWTDPIYRGKKPP